MNRWGIVIIVVAVLALVGTGFSARVDEKIYFTKASALTAGLYTLLFSLWNIASDDTEGANRVWEATGP